MDDRSEPKSDGENRDTGLRIVTIHRSEKGYGLVVSGESPVIVQDVKDGGPAALSGVKKGDSIICVNNTLVSKVNHKNVVDIIKSAQCVKLTLQSGEADIMQLSNGPQKSHHQTGMKPGDLITAPLPVNTKVQNILDESKAKMLQKYLDRECKVRDNILMELQKNPSKVLQNTMKDKLKSVERQISTIQEELKNCKEADSQSSQSYRSVNPSYPNPHHLTRSQSEMPPPLPARNRLFHQTSHVSLPNSKSSSANLSSHAPPLPPRPPHLERLADAVPAQNVENITKVSNLSYSTSSGSESSHRPTHQRVKSSPDPLGMQNAPAVSNRHSASDLVTEGTNWRFSAAISEDEPPPGTPPPPYLNHPSEEGMNHNYCTIPDEPDCNGPFIQSDGFLYVNTGNPSGFKYFSPYGSQITTPVTPVDQVGTSTTQLLDNWNTSILTMEEEDGDLAVDDHGPFRSLQKLLSDKYNAYLAVFTNYVISNCDASSLFFYLITAMYKEGGAKEMKKWAYEIHSSFLLPGAAMRLPSVDEGILYEIDETLQNELDKEEIMRKVFWKARQRARDDLNEQLADFRSKRSAGLGSLFGPTDVALEESVQNKCKELQIVEDLLVPCLDSVSEDLKNQTDQMLVMASSLATILWKCFGVKSPHAQQLIDKCPLFVNKDRPLRSKLLKSSKKQVVRDHNFILVTYYSVIHCNHCGLIIWGIAPQGYQCGNCEMNIHKSCVKSVEEICVGQVHRQEKTKDTKFSNFLLRIRPDEKERNRKQSQVSASQSHSKFYLDGQDAGDVEKARRGYEDADILGPYIDNENNTGDKIGVSGVGREPRRSDGGNGTSFLNHQNNGGSLDEESHVNADDPENQLDQPSPLPSNEIPPNNLGKSQGGQKKKSSSSINRSESCKEKQHSRKQARENRKNSDPNIPTSKTGDVDGENQLNFQSGSSSNSSLSQSQESPGNSAEVQAYASVLDNDSDVEAEADLPDWKSRLCPEELDSLTSKDRKRQETINEFFHTEQSHVRTLKVLQSLFYQPLRQSNYLSPELLDRLFPNLDQILRFHNGFNKSMKKRRHESTVIENIGDILKSMFIGDEGLQFQQAAAEFVAYQSCALEDLKQRQKRDPKLAIFLQDQENHHHCRRLQLKDMLPAGFQRLTKYPLLLESLLSYTDKKRYSEEHEIISKALERSREILAYVNAAVQDAENHRRLIDIQKKLDQSSLAKNKHGNCEELRGELDLTKHHLIYDGQLTWKTRGQKNIDLHVLILEDCVVLLQKDNDKYVLKYHSINKASGKDDNKLNHSPIIKFGTFIFRPVATDKCAFFIVLTQSTLGAQIYELVTISSSERNVWLRHLHEAQTNFEFREGRNRRSHSTQQLPDPEDNSTNTEQLKDVDSVDNQTTEQSDQTESCQKDPVTPDPQPSPNPSIPENVKKTDCGMVGGGVTNKHRRLQEVQIIQIVEGPDLVQPSEVTVSQGVVLTAQPVLTPIELLRRKDQKIRQELEEKQNLIADILNIPREHFESVADMATEVGLASKEPRELVLGAIFQAKKLQETLNEAQTVKESDVISVQADKGAESLPLYPAPMEKLLNISGSLTELLNSLLTLVSERDDERERMRKELVASRERLHHMHMQTKVDSDTCENTEAGSKADPTTPHSSRPNSYISITSSGTEQGDTAEPLLEQDKEDEPTEHLDSAQDKNCDATSIIPEETGDVLTLEEKTDT